MRPGTTRAGLDAAAAPDALPKAQNGARSEPQAAKPVVTGGAGGQAASSEVIFNCTAFAAGALPEGAQGAEASTSLALPAANRAPVLQVVLVDSSEEVWKCGLAGLSARDIAMNPALPEVDGCIFTRAISFRDEAFFDAAAKCLIAACRAPASERRVALVLTHDPDKDGWLDTLAATVSMLARLAAEGCRVRNPPMDADALIRAILAGPTGWLTDCAACKGGVDLSFADYQIDYGQLPSELRGRIESRWGPPEADPLFEPGDVDCGRFRLSVLQFGNVVVGLQTACGHDIDPRATAHTPDMAPPHSYLAFHFWLRYQFRAHAIVYIGRHIGKHGNLG